MAKFTNAMLAKLVEIANRKITFEYLTPDGRKRDDAPANAIENALGFPRNNHSVADWGNLDIKTKMRSTTLLTLFHSDTFQHNITVRDIIAANNYQGVRCTLEMGKNNAHLTGLPSGFFVTLNNDVLRVSHPYFGTVLQWNLNADGLYRYVLQKIYNVALFKLNVEHVKGDRYATIIPPSTVEIFEGISCEKFKEMIQDGIVKIEIDIGPGKIVNGVQKPIHNHGTKFRIYGKDMPKLYDVHRPLGNK